jgi:hypothetical protein
VLPGCGDIEDEVALMRAWCDASCALGGLAEGDTSAGGERLYASADIDAIVATAGEVGLVKPPLPDAEVEYARALVGAGAKVTDAEF